MNWRCEKNHTWVAKFRQDKLDTTKNYVWCAECDKYTIEDAKAFAKTKLGDCISDVKTFLTSDILKWKCVEGHEWDTTFGQVYSLGTWCPKCKINYGEETARVIFEKMFQKPFDGISQSRLVTRKAEEFIPF